MENQLKLVGFEDFCPKCKYEKLAEEEEPCRTCLIYPVNLDDHKPVKWEEK